MWAGHTVLLISGASLAGTPGALRNAAASIISGGGAALLDSALPGRPAKLRVSHVVSGREHAPTLLVLQKLSSKGLELLPGTPLIRVEWLTRSLANRSVLPLTARPSSTFLRKYERSLLLKININNWIFSTAGFHSQRSGNAEACYSSSTAATHRFP